MNIVLVRPNARRRSTYMPLGLGYIAQTVRAAGHRVGILDARLERLSVEQTVRRIIDFRPDVVGLTALHDAAEKKAVREVAGTFKAAGGTAPAVLGGGLASTVGKSLVADDVVDAAVVGEGERVFNEYLAKLDAGGGPAGIPGLIAGRGETHAPRPQRSYVKDVDRLGVAWDLLRPERYFSVSGQSSQSTIKKSSRCVPVLTSRGCPFGCIYCHNIFGRAFRGRSPENVVSEIVWLKEKHGVREIEIEDDCFNFDLERAKEIARQIIDRRLKLAISFPTGLRADLMDEELVDLLKAAGTYRIIYGVETAAGRIQKLVRKNLDFTRAERIIDYTAGRGIMTCGFFMQGFPTETEEEMRQTVDFAVGLKLHQAYFFYVNPFPGTQLAEKYAVDESVRSGDGRMGYNRLRVNLSAVPDTTVKKINKIAYRRFHFSMQRMVRTFLVVPKNIRTLWAVVIAVVLSFKDLEDF